MTDLTKSAARLGRSQVLVLRLLSFGERSARDLEYHWPGLTESAARSAVMRLGDRGLVDVAGFDGSRRTYRLTDAGHHVVRKLDADPEFDEAMS